MLEYNSFQAIVADRPIRKYIGSREEDLRARNETKQMYQENSGLPFPAKTTWFCDNHQEVDKNPVDARQRQAIGYPSIEHEVQWSRGYWQVQASPIQRFDTNDDARPCDASGNRRGDCGGLDTGDSKVQPIWFRQRYGSKSTRCWKPNRIEIPKESWHRCSSATRTSAPVANTTPRYATPFHLNSLR